MVSAFVRVRTKDLLDGRLLRVEEIGHTIAGLLLAFLVFARCADHFALVELARPIGFLIGWVPPCSAIPVHVVRRGTLLLDREHFVFERVQAEMQVQGSFSGGWNGLADFVVGIIEVVSLMERNGYAVVVLHEEVRWEIWSLLSSLSRWLLPRKLDLLARASFFEQIDVESFVPHRQRLLRSVRRPSGHEVCLLNLQRKVVVGLCFSMLHNLVFDLALLLQFLCWQEVLNVAFVFFLGACVLLQDLVEELFDLLCCQLLEVILKE